MKKILIIIFVIFVVSCKQNRATIIDTSSCGAINMIKIIGEDIFVLNSTKSSIQKIDRDSLKTVFDIDIKGRDFLLDFVIDGEDVYFSNTYDEIFKFRNNSITDTLKVFSPDKIAKMKDKLIVTSRIKNGFLYMIDLDTKEVLSKKLKSEEIKENTKFGQNSIVVLRNEVYMLDGSSATVSIFDENLELLKEIYLPQNINYGNISIVDDKPHILADENGKLSIYTLEINQYLKNNQNIDISTIDLHTSAIDKENLYLYDYLNGKIIIKNWKK